MTCKDCLHYEVCESYSKRESLATLYCAEECPGFTYKSEWVHLPCKKGDVLERNGERCEVDHWNVIATTFAEGGKLRLFNVEDAEKALEDKCGAKMDGKE